jgi:hypothetical protein
MYGSFLKTREVPDMENIIHIIKANPARIEIAAGIEKGR